MDNRSRFLNNLMGVKNESNAEAILNAKRDKIRVFISVLISAGIFIIICVILYKTLSRTAMKNFIFFVIVPVLFMLSIFYAVNALRRAAVFLYAHNNIKDFEGFPPKLIRMFLYKFLAVFFVTIVLYTTLFTHAYIPIFIIYIYLFTKIFDMWKYHKLPYKELFLPALGAVVFAVLMNAPVHMFLRFSWDLFYVTVWKYVL